MHFSMKHEKLLEKYNEIWKNVSNNIKRKFNSENSNKQNQMYVFIFRRNKRLDHHSSRNICNFYFSDFSRNFFLEKIQEFFKLGTRNLHFPKYKKFCQSGLVLLFKHGKFSPDI